MKKTILSKLVLPLIFCTLIQCTFGQQSNAYVDSLMKELRQHPQVDSDHIYLLIEISDAIANNKPDEALKYSDQAIELSRKIGWKRGIGHGYREKGSIYCSLSDYLKGIENYKMGLKEYGDGQDPRFEGSIYNNVGTVYMGMENFKDALSNFYKFLSMSRQNKWDREEGIVLMNIGLVYMKQDKLDSAISFFNASIKKATSLKDLQIQSYALSNKGAALEKQGHYDEAVVSFQQSIPLADSLNDMNIKAESLGGLAEIYMFRKDYGQAEKYAQQSLVLSKSLNIVQYQKEMYQTLSDLYTAQNKTDKAFSAYKSFISLRDSVMNEDKKSEIVKLEMKFDQEKQAALAASEINRQRLIRNVSVGGALVLLLAAITSFVFYKRRRDARQRQQVAEFNAQVSDTEMKALRAQMNPHFIFNSLNSIGQYISKNNLRAADDYLVKFARLMRSILENSEQKEVSLESDLKALEIYMELESMRMEGKFTYEIRVEEGIDPANTMVPPLILQPFVENSIWHGISKKEGKGNISIFITKQGDMIHCVVEDNGVGLQGPAVVSEERKSLGMKITGARIDILNKTKSAHASVRLSSLEQGTRAEIILPLELSF